MDKKQKAELKALHQALSARMTAKDKKILSSIIGPQKDWFVNWRSGDKPDLVHKYEDCVVGIEHFKVEGLSEKKNKAYHHLKPCFENALKKTLDRYVGKFDKETDTEQLEICGTLFENIYKLYHEFKDQGTQNSIDHLNVCLFGENGKGHVPKCNVYKTNLEKEFGKTVKLGLLIEVLGDFTDLVVFDGENYKTNDLGLLPLSWDIVQFLSTALENEYLDFIIFYRRFEPIEVLNFTNEISDKTLCETNAKTIIMTKPVDKNLPKMFHGEFIYARYPFEAVKTDSIKRDLFVRRKNADNTIDILENYNNDREIDVKKYWNLIFQGEMAVYSQYPYYADPELAAGIYALSHILHKWEKAEYVDNKKPKKGKQPGISPTDFDAYAFNFQVSCFLAWYYGEIQKKQKSKKKIRATHGK